MRLLIVLLFSSVSAFAQIGTGQWRLHIPAYEAVDLAIMDHKIYTAYTNGVSEFDPISGEISVWDYVNGLSDIDISCIEYCYADNSIFIAYKNGNLDKLRNNTITNIPAVALAQVQGSKYIHRMVEKNGYMFLATGFSIVKIDPLKNEVRDTYYPTNGNAPIVDIAFRNDTIFALSEERLYVGLFSNPALADPSQWTADPRTPNLPSGAVYQDIEKVGDVIYISVNYPTNGADELRVLNSGSLDIALTETFGMNIYTMQLLENRLTINYDGLSKIYNADLTSFEALYSYGFGFPYPRAVERDGGYLYVADARHGLVRAIGTEGERIALNGPPKRDFYKMDWNRGKLAIAGGGLSSIFHLYSLNGVYTFKNEEWDLFDFSNVPVWDANPTYDFLAVSVNPAETDEIAVGTFSHLPLSIINDGQVEAFTPSNSTLGEHSNGSGECFISDVVYDDAGNLWVLNGMSDYPLKVYTRDNEWYTINTGSLTTNHFSRRLVIDGNGHKWFSLTGVGVVGVDDGGSIETPTDDDYVILNSGENTGALPSIEVNALAVDLDNEIWIGTDNGFAVLYNSNGAFTAGPGDYNAQRIKLEYEGNVEYVLGATNITAIEVDGANRKWFGTANAGIVLLSPDGLEVIEQYTTENSPLISNTIVDLELDHSTGELFIITDKGLVSYRTDATNGTDNYDDVSVFPNPKRPDYDGLITIQGIKYDSDVRITDAGGRLVYQTTSNGGTATWNGRTLNGEKVSTGVYLIWTAPNDSDVKGRKVGKVLVVNE